MDKQRTHNTHEEKGVETGFATCVFMMPDVAKGIRAKPRR